MKQTSSLTGALLRPKGAAFPPPEPALRTKSKPVGRRVGAALPVDLYVRLKTYVAQHGVSGESVIVAAIELLLKDATQKTFR